MECLENLISNKKKHFSLSMSPSLNLHSKLLIDSRTMCIWALCFFGIYLSVGSLGSIRWNFRKLPPRFFRRSSGLVGVDDDDEGKDEPGILSMALLLLLFMNVSGTWHYECLKKMWKIYFLYEMLPPSFIRCLTKHKPNQLILSTACICWTS